MVNSDTTIMKSFISDRTLFDKFAPYIFSIKNMERNMRLMLNFIKQFYEKYADVSEILEPEFRIYLGSNDIHNFVSNNDIYIKSIFQTNISNVALTMDVLENTLERYFMAEVVDKAALVLDNKKTGVLSDIQEIIDDYHSLLRKPPAKELVEYVLDLDSIVKKEIIATGAPFVNPKPNDVIHGMRTGQLGLIYAYVDCYSSDTEILTENGWKLFKNLNKQEKVAQYTTTKAIEFVLPQKYSKCRYKGTMYYLHDTIGRFSQIVTPNHRVVYARGNKIKIERANNISPNQTQTFIRAGTISGKKTSLTPIERFLIAYQADGSKERNGCTGIRGHVTVRFSFAKERKIARLMYLCQINNFKYKTSIIKSKNKNHNNQIEFRVQIPKPLSKIFDWVELNSINFTWGKEFIYELAQWDSHIQTKHNIISYSSANKYNTDIIQAICALSNINCTYGHIKPVNKYHKPTHRLSIKKYQNTNGASIIKDTVDYNDYVYCVTVPSGMIVIKHDNKVSISGNTGKTSYGVANLCSIAKYLSDNNINRPVIYGANEEAVQRVTLRAIQCMTNWSDAEIAVNKKQVNAIIKKNGFGHMRFFDHVNNMRVVEKLLSTYNPRVIFLDQGTKINIPGSRKDGVNALEEVFNTFRDMAKRYDCTIVALTQGGDDCADKKFPALRDIYGSKSAIQGELDWAIAIGTDTSDIKYSNWRFFNISKNKGDKATYACRFDTKRCQFKEVT